MFSHFNRKLFTILLTVFLVFSMSNYTNAANEPYWVFGEQGSNEANLAYEILGIWGSSPSDVFGVGIIQDRIVEVDNPLILHFDGHTVTSMSIPRTTKLWLHDVWGSGQNDVWAVGSTETTYGSWVDPYLLHYDGTAWTDVTSTLPGNYGGGLISIWGLSANEIYVTAGGSYILKYDGSNWTEFYNMPSSNGMIGSGYGGKQIWGASSTDIYILAGGKPSAPQDVLVYHYNGSTWTEAFSQTGLRFNSIWGSGPNDVWLAADNGDTDPVRLDRLFHFNGTWGEVVLPDHESDVVTNGNGGLYAVGGSASDDVYAVGGHGNYYYDGSTWTTMESDCVFSVWAASPEIVFGGTYTIAKKGLQYVSSSGLPVIVTVGNSYFTHFTPIDPNTIVDQNNRPNELPYGLFYFSIPVADGETATVIFELDILLDESYQTWWNYSADEGWQQYSNVRFVDWIYSVRGPRTIISIDITDNGDGDNDPRLGWINGTSGPGSSGSSTGGSGGGGGGGGCFIQSSD